MAKKFDFTEISSIAEKEAAAKQQKAERVTFVSGREIMDKIRYIATAEHLKMKDVIEMAFLNSIQKYEKKNGEIILKKGMTKEDLFK